MIAVTVERCTILQRRIGNEARHSFDRIRRIVHDKTHTDKLSRFMGIRKMYKRHLPACCPRLSGFEGAKISSPKLTATP
jgi:hypothetical protein